MCYHHDYMFQMCLKCPMWLNYVCGHLTIAAICCSFVLNHILTSTHSRNETILENVFVWYRMTISIYWN